MTIGSQSNIATGYIGDPAAAAKLTCLIAGSVVAANWTALTNTGAFTIDINGTAYTDVNPDFTGDVTMSDVAASVQAAFTALFVNATVVWTGDHFEITGPTEGDSATMSVLRSPTPGPLVDLSAAGWMNGQEGYTSVVVIGRNILEKADDIIDDVDSVKTDTSYVFGAVSGIEAKGSLEYDHDLAGAGRGGEQTILTVNPALATDQWLIHGVWIDTTACTQNGYIRVYYQIDGANYRIVSEDAVLSTEQGHYININCGITDLFQVRYEDDAAETANRIIYYQTIYEKR